MVFSFNDLQIAVRTPLRRTLLEEGENDTRNGCYDGLQDFVPFGYDDAIEAGAGRDYIIVRDGNDRMVGEKGADWLLGGPGHDFLSGGEGDDIIYDGSRRMRSRAGVASTFCVSVMTVLLLTKSGASSRSSGLLTRTVTAPCLANL